MIMMMTHLRRKSPYVQVKTKANEETIVHIRQFVYTDSSNSSSLRKSTDGVMMTLMQFRSLMFHLRALDAQFTQGVPLNADTNDNKAVIGTKRSWTEMTENVPATVNALCSNDHQQFLKGFTVYVKASVLQHLTPCIYRHEQTVEKRRTLWPILSAC